MSRFRGEPLLLMSGNEASAVGAMHAGCRFFAGYPITPSSEILHFLAEWMPRAGGAFLQTEDELAAGLYVSPRHLRRLLYLEPDSIFGHYLDGVTQAQLAQGDKDSALAVLRATAVFEETLAKLRIQQQVIDSQAGVALPSAHRPRQLPLRRRG